MVNAAFMGGPYWHVVDVPWTPLRGYSETDDAYVIEAELPGVTKDNVNVEVNDREVVISGEIPRAGRGWGEGPPQAQSAPHRKVRAPLHPPRRH